jgi:hypothetical protein
MSKKIKKIKSDNISDAQVQAICQDLKKIREGLAVLGLHPQFLDEVADKLKKQAVEIERMKSTDLYTSGHTAGWESAFATGLTEEDDD